MSDIRSSFKKMIKESGGMKKYTNWDDFGLACIFAIAEFLLIIYTPNPQAVYAFIDKVTMTILSSNASIIGFVIAGFTLVITIIDKSIKKNLRDQNNDILLYTPYYFTLFLWILNTILNYFTNMIFSLYTASWVQVRYDILSDIRIYLFIFTSLTYFWALILTFHLIKTILIVDKYSVS
jgi:hypothetical protein